MPIRSCRARTAWALVVAVLGTMPVLVAQSELPGKQRRKAASAIVRLGGHVWTQRVERAVERGLTWLAEKQHPKGYWTGTVGHKQGDGYHTLRSEARQLADGTGHLGVTALAGMAFLAGGHLPGRGRYGKLVAKINEYVLSCIKHNGVITDSGTRMYSHAFATLYLAEVYGMSRDQRLRQGLEKAVQIIVDSQNEHGAWRYNPFSRAADLSVTVCQLQSLRAARNIGLKVPKTVIDKAVAYVKKSRTDGGPNNGLYYYKIVGRGRFRKNQQFAINAAAVTSLISAGVYDRDLFEPALEFLEKELPQLMHWYANHFYFWYGNYYASQAFFHAETMLDSRCFQRYYTAIRNHLLRDQRQDGRWINDVGPGDAFATAVACVLLQIPKQYLPIFQR